MSYFNTILLASLNKSKHNPEETVIKVLITDDDLSTNFQSVQYFPEYVDWGDGTINVELEHTYAKSGIYTIKFKAFAGIVTCPKQTIEALRLGNILVICESLFRSTMLHSVGSSFDTSNVTNMGNMFQYCNNLTNLDLSSFDTSKVNNMGAMFQYCNNLTNLDLSSFDTSNVTNMGAMFQYCNNLANLDLSNFDTSNVTNMGSVFQYCNNLANLDLSSFDTSNVNNMSSMFYYCSNLTNLDLSSFDTSNVNNMSSMFYYCSNLTNLDLSSFDTSNVTNMGAMFGYCNNLTNLDLSSFDTSNVNNMSSMFQYCNNLTNLDLSSFDTSNVTNMSSMFSYCQKLQRVYVKTLADKIKMDKVTYSYFKTELKSDNKNYTLLNSLTSTGTQTINTGYVLSDKSRIETKIKVSNKDSYIFGAWNGTSDISLYIDVNSDIIIKFGDYEYTDSTLKYQTGDILDIVFENGKLTITKNEVTETREFEKVGWFETAYDCALFGARTSSISISLGTMTVYYSKIYNDDNLVRDFVPVLDFNNEPCLFDKVTNDFYRNTSTGVFEHESI